LPFIDGGDRAEVSAALRIALKIPRAAWHTFDRVLAATWYGEELPPAIPGHAQPPAMPQGKLRPDPTARTKPEEEPPAADRSAGGEEPTWSPSARLRRKAFDDGAWSEHDLAVMEQLLARLAQRLAARRSRRWVPVPAPGRGRVDLRRSYRRALR